MKPLFKLVFTVGLALGFSLAFQVNARIIDVPDDFQTIQAAVNDADPGDTVLVQPGTYNESHIAITEAITVGSLFLTTGNMAHINSTIVNGQQQRKVFYLNNVPAGGKLVGLSIVNGLFNDGGGV